MSNLGETDDLTGLLNRDAFKSKLDAALSKLEKGQGMAVALIDLDHFRLVNDTFGHETGDKVLIEAAILLKNSAKEQDIVARLGGDEFVIARHLSEEENADTFGTFLSEIMHHQLHIEGQNIYLAASLGVTCTGTSQDTSQELLRDADTAMYKAKSSPLSSYMVFNSKFREEVSKKFRLESELRSAISENKIELAFQPLVDSVSQNILAIEALARWENKRLGFVPPIEFIDLAEKIGLINTLGEQILFKACAQLGEWRRSNPRLKNLRVSVNLSSDQLRDTNFYELVKRALAVNHLPGDALILELTEGTFLNDIVASTRLLSQLRENGVSIAIDDFGTGYSALSYLDQIPADFLKIDKSFVQSVSLNDDTSSANILAETIVDLAHHFGLRPVAEGVETETQRRHLRLSGCELVQGYLFAKPMSPNDPVLIEMLSKNTTAAEQYDSADLSPIGQSV